MERVLSLAVALVMSMLLGVPAFGSDTPVGVTDTDEGGIMLMYDLFNETANVNNGRWNSPYDFAAVSSYGKYIRYWHNNETDYDVTVYLYRVDSGREVLVSSMKVPANSNQSTVYYSSSADSGVYRIVLETFHADICGDVAAAQYAVPAFASDAPVADPVGVTDADEGGIMLLYDLYSARANSVNGRWDPPNVFSAVSSYGKYIRYWHNNETDYEVTLYLFRTDSGRDVQVSSVKVPAHDNKSAVYYNASADSGTYKIVIETFNGRILGDVAAAQYMSRPS